MQIYIMDSDYEVMKNLEACINSYPKHKAKCFTKPRQLVDMVRKVPPDIVLFDVDSFNGSSAVKMIQSVNPAIKIIIMSEDKEKVLEYFKFKSNGFLVKPIVEEKLKEQLFRVNHPLLARTKCLGKNLG